MLQGVDKNGIKPYQFHPVKSPLQNKFTILRPRQPQGIGDILYLFQPWQTISVFSKKSYPYTVICVFVHV